MESKPSSKPVDTNARIVSVDSYRGFVMLLMLAEVLRSCMVAAALPASGLWGLACYEQSHVAWVGASLHDLIQPGFYFLVGVGLLLSKSRRLSVGQAPAALALHTAIRSVILILLGMALVAVHPRQWTWWFPDTLSQIGLAYPFLFLVAIRPKRDWYLALIVILIGYWLVFVLYPVPPASFDYSAVGVSRQWLEAHGLTGFATHWQKNSNAAWSFDRWFLNLFPRETSFTGEENGLTTLNFVPSIGTMILGLIAGDVIRSGDFSSSKVVSLTSRGLILLVCGWMLGVAGVVPIVKAIWTPSWVLFSGGWCFLILAAFYGLIEGLRLRAMAFPLTVIGMNSLVAYSLSHLYSALAFNSLQTVFGGRIFQTFGVAYQPILYGSAVLATYWLVLYSLYRLRIFVRV